MVVVISPSLLSLQKITNRTHNPILWVTMEPMESNDSGSTQTSTNKTPTRTQVQILESEIEILKRGRESDRKWLDGRIEELEGNIRYLKLPGVIFAALIQWVITLLIGAVAALLLCHHIQKLLLAPTSVVSMTYALLGLSILLGLYKWLQEKYPTLR